MTGPTLESSIALNLAVLDDSELPAERPWRPTPDPSYEKRGSHSRTSVAFLKSMFPYFINRLIGQMQHSLGMRLPIELEPRLSSGLPLI